MYAMILQATAIIIVSVILTYLGASRTLKGALGISAMANIRKSSVGAIVVASVTALPELFSSVAAAVMGSSGLALGNILGSNIYNLPLLLGLAGLMGEFEISNEIAEQCAFLVGVNLVIAAAAMVTGSVPQALALGLLVMYLVFLWRSVKRGDGCVELSCGLGESLSAVALGGAALVVGSVLLVDNAVGLIRAFSYDPFLVGLVMSFGAIIPEVAVSLLSASKGEHEISVGNVVGDNVITATLVLGIVSFIQPIRVSAGEVLSTIPFTILFTGAVYLMHVRGWAVTRGTALLFLAATGITLVLQLAIH